jgi:hypothetical protein
MVFYGINSFKQESEFNKIMNAYKLILYFTSQTSASIFPSLILNISKNNLCSYRKSY